MYLFKIVFHAWKNHNDRHQCPKQQQEGESQAGDGGVVRWRAAWRQEAGGRAAQTRRLEKRRGRELAGNSYRFIFYEALGCGDNQGNACMAWNHCGWENKKKQKTNITNSTGSAVRATTFLLVDSSRKAEMKWWFTLAVIRPTISAAITTNLSLCSLSSAVSRLTEDSCMIQRQTAKRCVKHWSRDCSWDQPSFTKHENAPEYTSLGCKHSRIKFVWFTLVYTKL